MKKPRVSTIIIIGQFVLLLVSLGFLGFFIFENWISEHEAKDFAYQAGCAEAMSNYLRRQYSIYEMNLYEYGNDTGPIPYDGMTKPAGKMDGRFPVLYFLVDKDTPKIYREIQQQFVDGYNVQMRAYFAHPELYDNYGLRIPMRELHTRTNIFNLVK